MEMNSANNLPAKQLRALLPVSVDFNSHGASADLDFAREGKRFRDRLTSEARKFMLRYPSVEVSVSEGVAYVDRHARVEVAVQGGNSPTSEKGKELFRSWLAGRFPNVELRDATESFSTSDLCEGEEARNERSSASEGDQEDEIGDPPALGGCVRGKAATSLDEGSLKQQIGGAFQLEGECGSARGGRSAAGTSPPGLAAVGGPQKDSDGGLVLVKIPSASLESGQASGLTQAPGYAPAPTGRDLLFPGSSERSFNQAPDSSAPEPEPVPELFSAFELELEEPPLPELEKHFPESIEEAVYLVVKNQPVILLCPGAHALPPKQLQILLGKSKFEGNACVLAHLWSGPEKVGQDS